MTGTGHEGGLSGAQQQGSPCERCQRPARLVFSMTRAGDGLWLCGACLAELEARTAGHAVPRKQPARGSEERSRPGPGFAVGCAFALCLVIIWAAICLAALLHGR